MLKQTKREQIMREGFPLLLPGECSAQWNVGPQLSGALCEAEPGLTVSRPDPPEVGVPEAMVGEPCLLTPEQDGHPNTPLQSVTGTSAKRATLHSINQIMLTKKLNDPAHVWAYA